MTATSIDRASETMAEALRSGAGARASRRGTISAASA